MKMTKKLVMAAAALRSMAAFATTYYASETGSDDADCLGENTAGSLTAAWSKAIMNGTTNPQFNNRIVLLPGTYDLAQVDSAKTGDTLKGGSYLRLGTGTGKTVTLSVEGAGDTPADVVLTTTAAPSTSSKRAFHISGGTCITYVSNITFDSFDISQSSQAGYNAVGAAIYKESGTMYVSNCVFKANKTKGDGALAVQGSGTSYVYGCEFDANGSALHDNGGTLNVEGCRITNGVALKNSANAGSVVCTNCIFESFNSTATSTLGAYIYLTANGAAAVFKDCTFKDLKWSGTTTSWSISILLLTANSRFERCRFYNCGNAGSALGSVSLMGKSANNYVDGCVFSNCFYLTQGNALIVKNSLFIDSKLVNEKNVGSSLFAATAKSDICNCTFTGTTGSVAKDIVGNAYLKNSLFYGNVNKLANGTSNGYDFKLSAVTVTNCFYERADGTASATFFSDCGNRRIVSSVTDSDTQVASSDIKIAAATDPMPLMHSKRSALRGAGWFDEAMLSWKDIAGNPRVAQKDGVNVVDIGAYQYHVIPGLTVFVH